MLRKIGKNRNLTPCNWHWISGNYFLTNSDMNSDISGCWINQFSGWSRISQMGWGRQPLSLGWKPIIWQDFCRNLHANERYWTGGIPSALLGSANATAVSLFLSVRSFNHLSPRSFESEPGLANWVFFVISLYANVGTIMISSIGIRRNEIRTKI